MALRRVQVSEEDLYSSVMREAPTPAAPAAGPAGALQSPPHAPGDTNGALPPVKLQAWGNAGAGVAALKCAFPGARLKVLCAGAGCNVIQRTDTPQRLDARQGF